MFSNRYRRYIQTVLLVVPMSGIVTLVNTFIAKGLIGVLTFTTLQRWGVSILVAYPSVLIVMPIAVRITDRMIKR